MNLRSLVLVGTALISIAVAPAVLAESQGKAGIRSPNAAVEPQPAVACTGWHALCSFTQDCKTDDGVTADCDCWRVNETHIVLTSEIQDMAVKRSTQTRCTTRNECDVDEAPVCSALKSGQYKVDQVPHAWVSTFSYRGWCERIRPVACDTTDPEYVGDPRYAICDVAPCTEVENPTDPDRPLSCQCRVVEGPFFGTEGTCTGEDGGLISAVDLQYWDFEANRFSVPAPGYEYVQGACDPLSSDPWPPLD
jgi:hypothetical protein